MSKVFVFDTARCNGCYCCQIACKDEHCGNDWTPYAKAQPDTGQFWLQLHEYVRGTVPKVKMHYMPTLCNHCDMAGCMAACKVEGRSTSAMTDW
jgi:Fe-S-cluster-containing dehydrogenase component